jgi:serine phosphatase RsbU (regulator of sigma subunit)
MARLRNAFGQFWRRRRATDPGALRMPTADLVSWIAQSGNFQGVSQSALRRSGRSRQLTGKFIQLAPDDPLAAYFLKMPGPVEIETLHLDSPVLQALKSAGAKLVVPLISRGELVGLLHLGPRRSEHDYSLDDRGLLNTLATQAAPAVRVAQLVQEREASIQERERIEQELLVARVIQQTLLPKELPSLSGWRVASYYQPARAVGGDFYDFIPVRNGHLGIVVGDVTDKGVPAALLMAATRSILRAAAQRLTSPAKVLKRLNDLLCPDIPARMFVTCFYAVLDPLSGRLRYANAGHDLPQRWHNGEVAGLRATGMPLGLMPDMRYEEKETTLAPGESLLFYSDGLVEAHNAQREMFGMPRLIELLRQERGSERVIHDLLGSLAAFTGDNWEQEDDLTLVTIRRLEDQQDSI